MTRLSRRAIPFIGLGTTFLGVGASGPSRRPFIYVGLVFIALGLAIIFKRGRG